MAEGSAPSGRITNFDELQKWLESVENRHALSAIAARSALRSLPAVVKRSGTASQDYTGDDLIIATFRAILFASLAGASKPSEKNGFISHRAVSLPSNLVSGSADETSFAARAATNAAFASTNFSLSANSAALLACSDAARAARHTFGSFAARATGTGSVTLTHSESERVPKAVLAASFQDANLLLTETKNSRLVFGTLLWPANHPFPEWERIWEEFVLRSDFEEKWSFWIRWYQGFLDGQPMEWDLQRRIAFGVSEEAWEAGAEAVAQEIARIEEDWGKEREATASNVTEKTEDPYRNNETTRGLPIISEAEAKSLQDELHLRAKVTLPETTARFDVATVRVTSERAVRLAVDRVIDAFDDAKRLCGHNGFNEQRVEVVILDRAHTKYLEDAERLAFDYTDARLSLTQAIEDELPADSALQILISALGVAVTEICAADPEIEKALERNYQRDATDDDDEPPTRDGETTLLLTDAMRVFPEISSDALAERLQDGLSEVLTGEIVSDTPFDTDDGETQLRHAPRRSVVAEMASLTSDMYLKLQAAPKSVQAKLAKHYDSEVSKAVGVTARYSGALALIGAVAKYLAGLLGF